MSISKSALTKTNMAILGCLDSFYNFYNKLFDIFYKELNKLINENNGYTPTHWTVEDNIKQQYRSVFEELFNNYSYLFIEPPAKIHASTWAFKDFTMFEIDKKKQFKYKMISFQNFLYDIQFRVATIYNRQKQRHGLFFNFEDIYNEINNHILKEVEKSINKIVIRENTIVDITNQPLFIFEILSSTSCHRNNHSIIATPFYAPKIGTSEIIALPAHYCRHCNKYLIGKTTLSLYEKTFGKTLVERYKEKSEGNNFSSFRSESILHQFGYNVIDGELSEAERHDLLIAILSNKKMKYFDICKTIEQDIRWFDGKSGYELAVIKWKNDLKFLGDFVISHPDEK